MNKRQIAEIVDITENVEIETALWQIIGLQSLESNFHRPLN